MADHLGTLLDAVFDSERDRGAADAARVRRIDAARVFSEVTINTSALVAPDYVGFGGDAYQRDLTARVLVSEVACGLRIPERTAETLIVESQALVHDFPATLAALEQGQISYRHAHTLLDQAWTLPAAARPAFEAAVLPKAATLTVAKFDGVARRLREKLHPESIAVRHARCLGDRELTFEPAPDGMAYLHLYQSVEKVRAIFDRATGLARNLQRAREPRTLTQLRADAVTDVLIDGVTPGGLGQGIRANVAVMVSVMTLLGHDDEPAHIEGYGPIDADTARRLAAHAPSFTRLLTHPETGVILSVGRSRYKVPEDLRRWLRVRDETCRGPGCNRSAASCDIDHGVEWRDRGRTRYDNLSHQCKRMHKLKTETNWNMVQRVGGIVDWTSPTGHVYRTEPANLIEVPPPF
ncbi:HNH endonuclease signature motif containing protein [Leifsonia kafniensis]|uniref:HNH endonuclease signature motif containing protein n=2 Tax=Leifsonia kafniensis TaxID=475957 RepID=A0ABP7KG13_9MICO